ncbi:MAG: glycosyltransferase family 2 protein [Patescibacteria group bacterium]|jgi:hypothetical protein|nr:glycosyltransferase family 2 protein [Patescibacteria group bacterium]
MEKVNYLKIGKATDLEGKDRKFYRLLEMFPGVFAISTLVILVVLSYLKPTWVAYIIIAFSVYWLLLVIYLAIFLINAYFKLKKGVKTDWKKVCLDLGNLKDGEKDLPETSNAKKGMKWSDVNQLIILPTYSEGEEIISECLDSILNDNFPNEKKIIGLAFEERAGIEIVKKRAQNIEKKYKDKFGDFLISFHPDGIEGEIKGKGANQAWCATKLKKEIIDAKNLDYDNILVSVFDIDTVIDNGYFFALTYKFLTVADPYRCSYQPAPVYHNNVWDSPFFSVIAASSNTFWQMIMQIRHESLVTYSSHSMTFKALNDIGFWGTKNVSEDSRIFWHCFMFYDGHYRVEPIYFKVSMDVTADTSVLKTARNLYKQQRRWAWGSENIPYLIFNARKRWKHKGINKGKILEHIFIQIYGFHAWSTNALIIGVVGWLPIILGGDKFNGTVLSNNLPFITERLMTIAMVGLILSAVIAYLLLPKKPKKYKPYRKFWLTLSWVFIPVTIVIFGSIPCLEAQIRLMMGKYMGFWVTPKSR